MGTGKIRHWSMKPPLIYGGKTNFKQLCFEFCFYEWWLQFQ